MTGRHQRDGANPGHSTSASPSLRSREVSDRGTKEMIKEMTQPWPPHLHAIPLVRRRTKQMPQPLSPVGP